MAKPDGYKEINTETNVSNVFFIRYVKYLIQKKNLNIIIVIVGRTGCGKSYAAASFAEMLHRAGVAKEFSVDNIHFKVKDFIKHIQEKDETGKFVLSNGDCLVLDEAGVNISSRDWYSEINKKAMNVLETFRWRGLITIMTVPDFSFIDSKARKLINMQFEPIDIIERQNICVIKPFMISVDKKTGKIYNPYYKYKNPIDGHIYKITRLFLPIPSAKLRHEYDKKKEAYSTELTEEVLRTLELSEIKQKLNHFQKRILNIMQKDSSLGYREIADLLGMTEKNTYKNIKYVYYLMGKEFNENPPEEKSKE